MSIVVNGSDRIEMSQRERDRLKVLESVGQGQRTRAEAARLLGLSIRQVRRLQRRLQKEGDGVLVHGLRGQPSNHRIDPERRQRIVAEYRRCYADFGPTLASEKLAAQQLAVAPETLRTWLLAEGLWQRKRRRDIHRQRRPRRSCFGELVQMDTSIHDWLEGRGERMVLITLIDDATNRIEAGFYPGETVPSHFDLLGRWLHKHGRPLALYTDRDSIFEAQSKGSPDYAGQTQFGRALEELDMELILAHSPQAKGRIERFFGLAQDRWVKELRLAGVCTQAEANRLLRQKLVPQYNRRFTVTAGRASDAHRALGAKHFLPAILSVQEERVVANDYTIRFHNRCYQLHPPAWPGERGGQVRIELRLDGKMAIRFGEHYLKFHEIPAGCSERELRDVPLGGSAPQTPRSLTPSRPTPEGEKTDRVSAEETRSAGVQPTVGRSGRTPAEPYPPNGKAKLNQKGPHRPAQDHPWRGLPKKGNRRTFLSGPK
jgi:transposase